MQGTVVMLLALSGLGCHHKQAAPYGGGCYSTCYSGGCYSSGYTGCYSSCYSGGYSYGCYSSGYSGGYGGGCYGGGCYGGGYGGGCYGGGCYGGGARHHHGMFGCKRRTCQACCAPAPVVAACNTCGIGSDLPVYGTYTPVYAGYASGQYMGTMQSPASQMMAPAPAPTSSNYSAPAAPSAPSPGNPAPPAAPAPETPVTPPPPPGT